MNEQQVIESNGERRVNLSFKDCGCETHSGPHWIHMQRFWKEKNRALLRTGDNLGFLTEETARLKELVSIAEQLRLTHLPHFLT